MNVLSEKEAIFLIALFQIHLRFVGWGCLLTGPEAHWFAPQAKKIIKRRNEGYSHEAITKDYFLKAD